MIGFPQDSHQLDKMNFSMPQQLNYVNVHETFAHGSSESHFQHEFLLTLGGHGREALDILQTTCNQEVFHIARTNENSHMYCSTI
jgi:hypothetical protein